MQTVSVLGNLHEMLNPSFVEIYEKYFKMVSAEIYTKHAKHYLKQKQGYGRINKCLTENNEMKL